MSELDTAAPSSEAAADTTDTAAPIPDAASPSPETTGPSDDAVAKYWTEHNVTLHRQFASVEESLDYLGWRNDQYLGYAELMPVTGFSGASILDYGCGPGHDVVGFSHYSRPARLVGLDVSSSSLAEAADRLKLHASNVEFVLQAPDATVLPFDDYSFDLIHSSGVLHHILDPLPIISELHRVCRPGGQAQIMIYNADSVWMHLYVAYQKMVLEQQFAGLDMKAAFARSTDGENCPVARCYRAAEFATILEKAGFEVTGIGSSISCSPEMQLLPKRYDAIPDQRLPAASRKFLTQLTFDDRGRPMYDGRVAGIGLCFKARRR
jgi:ubiquinone/menaquinone biosynthesis C-methylase UbiE